MDYNPDPGTGDSLTALAYATGLSTSMCLTILYMERTSLRGGGALNTISRVMADATRYPAPPDGWVTLHRAEEWYARTLLDTARSLFESRNGHWAIIAGANYPTLLLRRVTLRYLLGEERYISAMEVAELLGIPYHTAYSRLRVARDLRRATYKRWKHDRATVYWRDDVEREIAHWATYGHTSGAALQGKTLTSGTIETGLILRGAPEPEDLRRERHGAFLDSFTRRRPRRGLRRGKPAESRRKRSAAARAALKGGAHG